MKTEDLKEYLVKHLKWLNNEDGGERANLTGANLTGANLTGADLFRADLPGANLTGANLTGVNLFRANLTGVNLFRANLTGANLTGADLTGAIIKNTILNAHFICPEEGEFTAWKQGADKAIIKLLIPADAKRMTSLVGRKCRAEKAMVLEIKDSSGNELKQCGGWRQPDFIYKTGEVAIPDSYDPDIRIEGSHGIYFFITRQEAVDM